MKKFLLIFCLLLAGCSEPVNETDEYSLATIESADILMLESFPVQVNVNVKGYLNNGCEKIDEVFSERDEEIFKVFITKKSEGDVCTQALVPFEENVNLDVYGLDEGNYTVLVNNENYGSFKLESPNK